MKKIKLLRKLNVFEKADTQSTMLGTLEEGAYELSEFLKNQPDSNTDYALVFDPEKRRNVWVCVRYKQETYAIVDAEKSSGIQGEKSIDEQALVELLPLFSDYSYDLKEAYYPFQLPGCKVPVSGPKQNNCCTFVEALIVKAWENSFPGFNWSNQNHGKMMIFSADDFFSPITCLVAENMATAIEDTDEAPKPWTVVQGWRPQWKGGHTFMILDYHEATDRVLTLESNSFYQLNGVGYRMLGNFSEVGNPGSEWWRNDDLWTWSRIKSAYPNHKTARLHVKNIAWLNNKK